MPVAQEHHAVGPRRQLSVVGHDEAGDASLLAARPWIDECYAADSVEGIVARLRDHDHPDAREAADAISRHSPTSLAVTLRARRVAPLSAVAGSRMLSAVMVMAIDRTLWTVARNYPRKVSNSLSGARKCPRSSALVTGGLDDGRISP